MSFLTLLSNKTPFAADKFVLVAPDGQEVTLLVVAATFEAPNGKGFEVAGAQPEILVDGKKIGASGA